MGHVLFVKCSRWANFEHLELLLPQQLKMPFICCALELAVVAATPAWGEMLPAEMAVAGAAAADTATPVQIGTTDVRLAAAAAAGSAAAGCREGKCCV